MKPLTLDEIVRAMDGQVDRPLPAGSAGRVVIDSREVRAGDLFVAIRGQQHDGHQFVAGALAAGAVAAVVAEDADRRQMGDVGLGVLIRVRNTVTALGRLARYYRREVIDGSVTLIAVTGSMGKTTTKAMIAQVLSGRLRGRSAVKSFNNEIGVPLTVLSTEPSDQFLVCEVGTNAPGEIAALARLVEPEIAVITCVAEVHLEGLGSLQGVAEEKMTLLGSLRPDGLAVVNADTELLRTLLARDARYMHLKRVTFGTWGEADLRLTAVSVEPGTDGGPGGVAFTVNDRFAYRLPTPGRHNALNALAAIAVGRRFGMDHAEIAERLAGVQMPPMRLQWERIGGMTVINDGYNANPAAMAAAVDVLMEAPAADRRVMIVGDMRELGGVAEDRHRELAEQLAGSGVNLVIAVGEHAPLICRTIRRAAGDRMTCHAYGSAALARKRVAGLLRPDDTVLLKGSRAIGLEVLLDSIRRKATQPTAPRGQQTPRRGKACRAG